MEIKQDKRNYRRHSDKNKRIIKKSLDEFGAGRSILIDNEGEIIAGNGVKEQWGDKPIKVVETDGTELIVVKRTDLNTNDEKRKQLALIDNHASDTSEFDFDLIKDDFDSDFLDGFEIETPKIDLDISDIDEVDEFNESVNFTVKCESIEQLEDLQTKLNTSSKKVSYEEFIVKTGL